MGEILNVEVYIDGLMRVGTTSEELFSKLTRSLNQLEDLFLYGNNRNARNIVRTCIAQSRMLFDQEQLMSSAREYLIRRIEILKLRERDLNHEISVLRAASFPEERGQRVDRDRSHELSFIPTNMGSTMQSSAQVDIANINLDRDTILREIDKSELNLSKLGEEIMHKKEILHDIDSRIEDASRGSLCHEQPGNSGRTLPPLHANEPEIITGSERVGRTRSHFESRPRGGVPQNKTYIYSSMEMSQINKSTSEEFGTSGRLGDAVSGVARSSSDEGNLCMGAACVHEEIATAADIESAPDLQQQQEASPNKRLEEEITHSVKGKRKATTSPESNEDDVGIITTPRRPNKTRVVAAHELMTTLPEKEEDHRNGRSG